MKKDKIVEFFYTIVIIVIAPLVLISWLPLMFKALLRYIADKDKSFYTFSDHLTDVRRQSKSFTKHLQEMRSKGIYVD